MEIHNQFAFEPKLRYAGFLWDFVAEIQHIGRSVVSGHYVSLTRSDGGLFNRLIDEAAVRIESPHGARRPIGGETSFLSYGKRTHPPRRWIIGDPPRLETSIPRQSIWSFGRRDAA